MHTTVSHRHRNKIIFVVVGIPKYDLRPYKVDFWMAAVYSIITSYQGWDRWFLFLPEMRRDVAKCITRNLQTAHKLGSSYATGRVFTNKRVVSTTLTMVSIHTLMTVPYLSVFFVTSDKWTSMLHSIFDSIPIWWTHATCLTRPSCHSSKTITNTQ